ncbi:Protein of unknown function [Bacillus cereus]|nr:Protein of unknown function [Bacillus cereus]
MKIQIVLFDGFGELVSFAPFEVLNRAIEEGAPFTVEFVSSEPKQEVTTSFGVTVKLHDFLRMDNRPDLLIVPGVAGIIKLNMGHESKQSLVL